MKKISSISSCGPRRCHKHNNGAVQRRNFRPGTVSPHYAARKQWRWHSTSRPMGFFLGGGVFASRCDDLDNWATVVLNRWLLLLWRPPLMSRILERFDVDVPVNWLLLCKFKMHHHQAPLRFRHSKEWTAQLPFIQHLHTKLKTLRRLLQGMGGGGHAARQRRIALQQHCVRPGTSPVCTGSTTLRVRQENSGGRSKPIFAISAMNSILRMRSMNCREGQKHNAALRAWPETGFRLI